MKTKVVNIRGDVPYDIYIGRPSKWGNPFKIGVHGDRKHVVEMYRGWIWTQPHLTQDIPSLVGKTLGCHCKPLLCHGDVLVELAESFRVATEAY